MTAAPRSLNVQITTRTLLIAALVVFLCLALASIADALLIVFLGIFLGLVFEAPTRLVMQRTRLSRGLAATVIVLGAAVAVALLALWLLVPIVESVISFLQDLPQTVQELQDKLPSSIGDSSGAENAQDGAQTVSANVPDAVSAALGLAGEAFSAFLAAFTLIFLAIFFISDAPSLQKALASILPPGESERSADLWERISTTIGRWAIGAMAIAVIAGTVQGTTAWILGSSYALALGLIAGFLDLIPNIGATIAGFILCLTLLAEEGPRAAVIMLVVVLVYQQVENNVLTPTIQGKATNISGFFVISGVTLFGALLGVLGALIAVPITASVQIIVQEYTKERRERFARLREAEAVAAPPPA